MSETNKLDSPGRPGREALIKTTNVCDEIHFDRVSSTLCDLGPVRPLKWSTLISAEHQISMWRCRTSQISQTPARLSGFVFFHYFRKKFKKVAPKAGTGWCLHPWLIDLKRGHFWSSFRIMRQTTKAHWACPDPQILPAKSDYFPKEQQKNRISKVLFCQSQRKERFAQQ